MLLRDARPDDREAIAELHRSAFAASERGYGGEAELVERLSDDGDLVFSHVAEEYGRVIGHVALSPMEAQADGRPVRALGLGPIAVLPDRQREGVGSALMAAAIDWARQQDFAAIFLLGNPDYYRRFGFSVDDAGAFSSPFAGPYWQLLILDDAFQLPKAGRADYAAAFAAIGDG